MQSVPERIIKFLLSSLAGLAAAGLLLLPAAAQQLPLESRLNEQVIMVPAGRQQSVQLETTVYKPAGDGPFPLLIINHGKAPGDPKLQNRDRFVFMAAHFVRKGYAVVVPMRTGFARSTGKFIEYGCNMTANGYAQAGDIADVVAWARQQDWIDREHIVIAGQSFGGLASVALSTQELPGVRGIMNFAGGLKVHGNACDWKGQLVKAFGEYGRKNKIESMWMYGANDSYFGPELVSRMHGAFTAAGGHAQLIAYGPFKHDAHTMLGSRDGQPVWQPEVDRFLAHIGMPVKDVYAVAEPPPQRASNFAALDDAAAVPFLPERGREQYKAFLKKDTPRAFAVSPTGAWGWAEEGESTNERALAVCNAASKLPCQLYTVDNDVVWSGHAKGSANVNSNASAAGGGMQ